MRHTTIFRAQFFSLSLVLSSLATPILMHSETAYGAPICEHLFEMSKSAIAEVSPETESLNRAQRIVQTVMPALMARTQSPMVITQYILQTSIDQTAKVARFLKTTELPGAEIEKSPANSLKQESNQFEKNLMKLANLVDQTKSRFGRLLQIFSRPTKKVRHLAAELEKSSEKLGEFITEVQKETTALGELYPQVRANAEIIDAEITYLNNVVEVLSQQAWTLPFNHPTRTAIETEINPAIMMSIVGLRSTQALAAGVLEAVDQRAKANNFLIQEAVQLKDSAFPAFLAASPNIKKLTQEAKVEDETESLNRIGPEPFCVIHDICLGDIAYSTSGEKGKVAGIYPDGLISIKTSWSEVRTFRREDLAVFNRKNVHRGIRPGDEGMGLTDVPARIVSGTVVGILPNGDFLLENLTGIHYVQGIKMGHTNWGFHNLVTGKRAVSKSGFTGTLKAIFPGINGVVLESWANRRLFNAEDVSMSE